MLRGHSDRHNSTSYTPIVTFHILTPEAPVTDGDQVFPISISGGKSWAQQYVDRYQVGAEYDGYVSTTGRPVAYLIAKASILPYVFVVILGGIGFWFVRVKSREAGGGMRAFLISLQVLFASNLLLSIIHYVWIMFASPHS